MDAQSPLPIGVGYLGWLLDKHKGEELISIALENRVQAIWLSFGDNLEKWIKFIRNSEANRGAQEKTKIFIVVSSVSEALVAVNEWKADAIIAQGSSSALYYRPNSSKHSQAQKLGGMDHPPERHSSPWYPRSLLQSLRTVRPSLPRGVW